VASPNPALAVPLRETSALRPLFRTNASSSGVRPQYEKVATWRAAASRRHQAISCPQGWPTWPTPPATPPASAAPSPAAQPGADATQGPGARDGPGAVNASGRHVRAWTRSATPSPCATGCPYSASRELFSRTALPIGRAVRASAQAPCCFAKNTVERVTIDLVPDAARSFGRRITPRRPRAEHVRNVLWRARWPATRTVVASGFSVARSGAPGKIRRRCRDPCH
jgi:hypothetical protein